jgi:hypothetical protein
MMACSTHSDKGVRELGSSAIPALPQYRVASYRLTAHSHLSLCPESPFLRTPLRPLKTMAQSLVGECPNQFQFTPDQDWFSHNIPAWTALKARLETSTPRVLEIGSWEGRSGVWILQNLCSQGGSLVCIDHFDLMSTTAGCERHVRIMHNLSLTGGNFRVIDSFSFPALMDLLGEEMKLKNPEAGYDWIYVDGSHEADDTCES